VLVIRHSAGGLLQYPAHQQPVRDPSCQRKSDKLSEHARLDQELIGLVTARHLLPADAARTRAHQDTQAALHT
jgi:hypothetical protein